MLGARQAECPNCGAPIEWRLASSQAAVCGYCQFAVVRTDRDLRSIGRVADLVPTAAPLTVGDEGSARGRAFRVLGRVQLDHGRGPWDEWYVGFADGTWGWLARAEGRWYLTFDAQLPRSSAQPAPSWDELTPGARLELAGSAWVVTERGGSAVLSAEGELPFPVDPRGSGRYADLEGEGRAFATLDFGDGSEPPRLFTGRELAHDELTLTRNAVGPRPVERVAVGKLSCPGCGAPVALFVPSECERVGCVHCGALLDHAAGKLALLQQLEPPALAPLIPLGSEGELLGQKRTVIGFMQREIRVDGELFSWREYLLHAERGYSWLVEDNYHWLHVAPIASSAVREHGGHATYDGTRYRRFAVAEPEVSFVVGEFYWKVQAGDRAQTVDYIAPPRALSLERSEGEITWSEGEYVEPARLRKAFGLKAPLPRPVGVAPAQPNPHAGRAATLVFGLLAFLWFLLAFSYEFGHRKQTLRYDELVLTDRAPYGATSGPLASNVVLTESFVVPRGPTTIELDLKSPISNGSVFVEASLIPEAPAGEPRVLPLLVEHYQGSEDGEGWSEGDQEVSSYFGRVEAGKYSFRFVGSWEPYDNGWAPQLSAPKVSLVATVGARSPACCLGTLFLIALPFLLTRARYAAFEARRRQNENLG